MSRREGSGLDSGRMPEGWTSSIQVLISITRVMCRAVLSTEVQEVQLFSLSVTSMDKNRKEYIRGTA